AGLSKPTSAPPATLPAATAAGALHPREARRLELDPAQHWTRQHFTGPTGLSLAPCRRTQPPRSQLGGTWAHAAPAWEFCRLGARTARPTCTQDTRSNSHR